MLVDKEFGGPDKIDLQFVLCKQNRVPSSP